MEQTAAQTGEALPGRECGTCNVCCVALTIKDPELQKPQGYRCHHLTADHRCGIYETRPTTCRRFDCGWRILKWVRPTLRPDRSGVLVRAHLERSAATKSDKPGIIVTLLSRSALKAEGLAETVAAAVSAGAPVWVHIPGPPGYTAGVARLDHALLGPVLALDKAAVLEVLRQAYRTGKAGKFEPLRLEGPAEA